MIQATTMTPADDREDKDHNDIYTACAWRRRNGKEWVIYVSSQTTTRSSLACLSLCSAGVLTRMRDVDVLRFRALAPLSLRARAGRR